MEPGVCGALFCVLRCWCYYKVFTAWRLTLTTPELKKSEERAFWLFLGCVALAVVVLLFEILVIQSSWAPVVGFVKAFIFGGVAALIPAVYAAFSFYRSQAQSSTLKFVLVISLLWFLTVAVTLAVSR